MSIKLPKTFKSKKQLLSWLKKNHEKLKNAVFTNKLCNIHYLVYCVQENTPYCHFITVSNTNNNDYRIEYSEFDCWGKLNGQSVEEFLEEDFDSVSDDMIQKYESLVRDDFIYHVRSGLNEQPEENCEYTIIDYRTDSQVLDFIRYLEDDVTEYNDGKVKYIPTINERFAYLIDRFDSTFKNEKEYVKTLDIRDKAIFYGANPEFDIFNKNWIKDEFGYWIVSYDSLTKKQAKVIYEYAKRKIEDRDYEIECKKQRSEKGYSKSDVWNFNNWFTEIVSKMLKELADNHMGYPSEIDKQYFKKNKHLLYTQKYDEWISVATNKKQEKQKDKASKICDKEWTDILNRMIFLLNEADEETCSMASESDALFDVCSDINAEFTHQYGSCGSKLKDTLTIKDVWPEEEFRKNVLKNLRKKNFIETAKSKNIKISENMTISDMEKVRPGCLMLNPSYLPKNNELRIRYEDAEKKYRKHLIKMLKYREKCKNEFFDLMKKWFWCLWD